MMENILSDWQGFDCLNVLKVQTNWKSAYLEEIERQKRQFAEKFIKQKEKRCRNVCVSYEKNENYKPKPKKWKVKLPNGDIESFDNKRDAECFASVMRCFILDFPYENIKTKSSSGLQRSRLRSDK